MFILMCKSICLDLAYAGLQFESSFQKHRNYFKLGVNEHVNITHFHDFSKTFVISVFTITFPGLETTI